MTHPALVARAARLHDAVEAALVAEREPIDSRLDELFDTACVAPKVDAVKFLDPETAESVACQLKPDADYIIIERSMAKELVLLAIERKRIGELEGI